MEELFTGLELRVQGHLKIFEYENREALARREPSRLLLNRRNAIHKDHVAILAVKAMTNRPAGQIAYMYFGSGGTTIDNTGTVIFNPPNDTALDGDLYQPVYFQLVDDTLGGLAGNSMGIRHISGSMFADLEVRCLIGQNQPFGQLTANTLPEITTPTTILNLNDSQFAFDEIGLKTIDGTLITHVVFVPVVKTASSLLEVVYTIRVAIAQPAFVAPPPPPPPFLDLFLTGVHATSATGGPDVAIVECSSGFIWSSNYINANGLATQGARFTNTLDKFGNFFVNTNKVLSVNPAGSVISAMTCTDLADAVDAWYGSPIVSRGTGFDPNRGFYSQVINQGNYIIAYFPAEGLGLFANWYVILQPSAVGNPTVLGAVWYRTGLGPPYLNEPHIMESNTHSASDPLLMKSSFGIGGGTFSLTLIPSINDIKNGTYMAGYGLGFIALQIPVVSGYPIGNVAFSSNLILNTGAPNGNSQIGFTLPDPSGGTNLYFYFNRACMDANASGGNQNNELRNVLQPAYPNGAIVKVSLGVLNFATAALAGNFNSTTANYTVDNANWVNQMFVSQIPFTDEYTFISTGLPGGTDSYTMQPGGVIDRGGGIWWVIFYMPGIKDAQLNTGGSLHENIRIFSYNKTTQRATQLFLHGCVVYTSVQMPEDVQFNDFGQAISISSVGSLFDITIHGNRADAGNQLIYASDFGKFSL